MGWCKCLSILFAFTFLSWFDFTLALDDREHDKKYMAFDESLAVLEEYMKLYKNVSEEDSGGEDGDKDDEDKDSVFGMLTGWYSGEKIIPTLEEFTEPPHKGVKLLFHNPQEPDGIEFNIYSLEEVPFNSSLPTRIICHGWMASMDTMVMQGIKDAYMAYGHNNVIAVDWSFYSKDVVYPLPAKFTRKVGKYIAEVIDAMVDRFNAKHSDFHLIGHSLGAHVSGFAGSNTRQKVGRITGLDPALPGFQYMQGLDGRLDASDATFVDVIHTCSGLLGMSVPVGHVDFFPNGGSPFQPGCLSLILPKTNSCSHGRASEYFIESIMDHSQFLAVRCKDWATFKEKNCDDIFTLMGENVSRDLRGIFYLTTNDNYPFAKGVEGTTP